MPCVLAEHDEELQAVDDEFTSVLVLRGLLVMSWPLVVFTL
jgi:hypothetical protein